MVSHSCIPALRAVQQLTLEAAGGIENPMKHGHLPLLALLPAWSNVALAQVGQACAEGTAAGESDVGGFWFFAGCLGVVGLLLAYIVEPSPPGASLIGKSPEYVAAYTDCYIRAGK